MIESVVIYTLCILMTFVLSSRRYTNSGSVSCLENDQPNYDKMPIVMILVLAAAYTFFNYYVTETSIRFGGDRTNYEYDFETGRFNPSIGITFLYTIWHTYDLSFKSLMYFCTFVPMVMVLFAYRVSKDATPHALLLFMLSPFLIVTFTALKQSFASAATVLMLVIMLNRSTRKLEPICWILILVACLFHPSGYLSVVLYVLLKLNFKVGGITSLLLICIVVLLFKPMLLEVAEITSNVFPFLSDKIFEYFGENADGELGGLLVTLKGLPYYIITYVGIKYKHHLKSTMANYHSYVLLSVICSLSFITSYFEVWMARLEFLLSFPVLILAGKIYENKMIPSIFSDAILLSLGFFTYRLLILIYINFGFF